MIKKEARLFLSGLKRFPATRLELESLFDDFIDGLDKEKAFDKLALHDDRCECYDGAWCCGCSKRRYGDLK